jgi:O-antigen ligase
MREVAASFHRRLCESGVSWSHALLVLALPFSLYRPLARPSMPGVLDIYVTPGIYLTDFAILGVLLSTLLLQKPWRNPFFGERKITFPFLTLVGLAVLSIPWSMSPKVALYSAFRWLIALLLYLALLQIRFPIERTIAVFLVGLSIHALIGALQVLHQGPLGLPGELIPVWDPSRVASIQVGSHWSLRAYGLTFHPNVLGGFMAVGLILSLPLLRKTWAIPFWMLLWMGLFLSFSRSAWLAVALALPLVVGALIWQRVQMRRRYLIISVLVIVLLLAFVLLQFDQLRGRLSLITSPSERASWSGRGELIVTSLRAIMARPWTGLGAGNFPLAASIASIEEVPHPVHNIPLLMASEIGILGGIIWLCLWLLPGLTLLSSGTKKELWSLVLVASWLAIGIIGLWDFYPWGLESGRLLSVTLLAWTSRTLAQAHLSQNILLKNDRMLTMPIGKTSS